MFSNDNVNCSHALRRILQIIKQHNTKTRLMEKCEIESYLQEIELGCFRTRIEQFLAVNCKKQLEIILKTYEEFELALSNRYLSDEFSSENAGQMSANKSQSIVLNKRVSSSIESDIPVKRCCLNEQVLNLPSQGKQSSLLSPDLFDQNSIGFKSQIISNNDDVSNNIEDTFTITSCDSSKQSALLDKKSLQNNKTLNQPLMISIDQGMQNIHISAKSNSYIQCKPPTPNDHPLSPLRTQTENCTILDSHANKKKPENNNNIVQLCTNFTDYSIDDMPIIFADDNTEFNNGIVTSNMECHPVSQIRSIDKRNTKKAQNANGNGVEHSYNANISDGSAPIMNLARLSNCNLVDGDATTEEICSTLKETVAHIKTLYAHIKEGFVTATKELEDHKPLPEGFVEEMLKSGSLNCDRKLHLLTMLFERRSSDCD